MDSAFYSNRIPFELIETDYVQNLEKTLKGVDALIHLAGMRYQKEKPMKDYITDDILMTNQLFHAAASSGIRNIVFASSISVYNSEMNAIPFKENQNCYPATPYGISKLTGEKIAYYYDHQFGTRTKCLRMGQVIGSEEREGFMVHTLIRQARYKQTVSVWGKGSGTRDCMYVKDVARAIVLALEHPESLGAFNISCGEPISHLRLAEEINRAFNNRGNLKLDSTKKEDRVPFFCRRIKRSKSSAGKPNGISRTC